MKDGLRGTFFATEDVTGESIFTQERMGTDFWFNVNWLNGQVKPVAGTWTGNLSVPEDGTYQFVMTHAGSVRVFVDGKQVLQGAAQDSAWHGGQSSSGTIELQAGKVHELLIEYVRPAQQEVIHFNLGIGMTFPSGVDPRLARAVEAARSCDVAVVFAGYPEGFETEGTDRPSMNLMGNQEALINAVAAANPRTVVVLNAGAPVAMPWLDRVAAVVLAYYPGQESGNALSAVLLGEVNPSGKLPVTFPVRLQDCPAYTNNSYPGCREVVYGEGIFVGYRYFDTRDITPLFPFGHGLSYTEFEYSNLVISKPVKGKAEVEVSLEVKNTGKVSGKEVVQLYVADPQASLPRPTKELKGFAKIELKPGQTKTLTFSLDERSLAYFDPVARKWVAEPGEFKILVGSSSRDIRLEGTFLLE